MKVTYDVLKEHVAKLLDGRTDDEALSILEDFADSEPATDPENWKEKFEENDKMWRERYRDRFMNGNSRELAVEEQLVQEEQTESPEEAEIDTEKLYEMVFDDEEKEEK